MSARVWLWQRMIADELLKALLQRDDRSFDDGAEAVFQSKGMFNSPGKWPYIVYVMGNDTEEGRGHGDTAHRQFAQLWIHDDQARMDYMTIDLIVRRLRELFNSPQTNGSEGVISSVALETSRDLDDQELGTICKYLRLQLICSV